MPTQDTITVLGKIFSSEEERREYFREELRKKLPELKQMEGFPIGEDADIIKLSDPPYYTACPNPWLNDFIAEWEEEKKQLEKDGKRSADFDVIAPYASDVSEGKNNPIYNAHSYHTKVPHPAIMRYILHYTEPGDVVFDGFAGTGMTGVASHFLDGQNLELKYSLKGSNTNNYKWGKRHAILSDISTVASFIASNYNRKVEIEDFMKEILEALKEVKRNHDWIYETKHTNGQTGLINYTIWSEVFACSNCNSEIIFFDSFVDRENKEVNDESVCPTCSKFLSKSDLERFYETLNVPGVGVKQVIKRRPVLIKYLVGKKRFEKTPDESDLKNINLINELSIETWFPSNSIERMDKTNELVRLGIDTVDQLYTYRNLYALSVLKDLCKSNQALLVHNSINTTLTSKLVRYNLGKRGNGILTGTYYVPSLIAESNVFKVFEGKIRDFQKAFRQLGNNPVQSTSSTDLKNIANNSVDYIFTDPPFGANIMYSELNLIQESWLKVLTNITTEAIQNRFQNKGFQEYTNLISKCMIEFCRILKPGKWMTVEFSNTNAGVWNSIQTALQNAGFVVANVAGLDKKQGSFNAVSNPTSVKQDLVISCYKPSSNFDEKFRKHQESDLGVWDFVEEHLNHLPIHIVKDNATTSIIERSPKILFDRLVAFYVQRSLPVPIDAGKFQKGLRERFTERDGMFFTHEQVQEYDQKKAEVPDFVQLSILVASEQDGILWLKNLLKDNPQTYQEIQPKWMQALAGLRKGDILPELMDILKDNFIENDNGQWSVADPENEADLDKIRNRRLLKLFEDYRTEANKPRGKIKEARVEALRAGFKQCYQDKDFKAIVQVGDKIPNNLLMEDEVLLQFYDIASTRV